MNQQTGGGRRAFLRRSGAVVSAMLVPAAGVARTPERSGLQDDAVAIRELYRNYAAHPAALAFEDPSRELVQVLQDPAQSRDTITVAPDGQSANAQFHCFAQVAVPLTGSASPLEMARLQGQHSETWWESGVHELDCVKTDEGWQILRLVYRSAGPKSLNLP